MILKEILTSLMNCCSGRSWVDSNLPWIMWVLNVSYSLGVTLLTNDLECDLCLFLQKVAIFLIALIPIYSVWILSNPFQVSPVIANYFCPFYLHIYSFVSSFQHLIYPLTKQFLDYSSFSDLYSQFLVSLVSISVMRFTFAIYFSLQHHHWLVL
jgi:hypothetical protein